MQIGLTGGAGFVGSYVLRELAARGHVVRCLVREGGAPEVRRDQDVRFVVGDVTKPESLSGLFHGCEAVIHLVGIIEEDKAEGVTFAAIHADGTRNVIREARASNVSRFVFLSANGARPDGVSRYQTSKWRAEEMLRQARFAHWAILRPSLIFGDPGPGQLDFCTRMARDLIRPSPIIPLFGRGLVELQPISVEEVALAVVQAITMPAVHARTICAVGMERYTYTEIVDRITLGLGQRPKRKVSSPVWLARRLIRWLDPTNLLPISADQFEMLLDGNTGNSEAFYEAFDVTYRPFTPENLAYVRRRA